MLNWSNRFSIFCFLDSHNYQTGPHSIDCILAIGAKNQFCAEPGTALLEFQKFIDLQPGWLFGHLGYDLKNEIEDLASNHNNRHQFPVVFFFEPELIIRLTEQELIIEGSEKAEIVFTEIMEANVEECNVESFDQQKLKQRFSKEEYISTVNELKKHILRGDCYEINFCNEYFAEDTTIDALSVYRKLSSLSPNPFSAFYKIEDQYLICASPERYLRKEGNKILSQPIKGTSSRFLQDENKDAKSKQELNKSSKDRSENVMVVDLVRNDLSRICVEGTVTVDELFGVYSFPQVHQMISTVSGKLKENTSFEEIIRATFPMGSMTGAPKKSVMEMIEKYERSNRGIFSGALGYINSNGDFDFNVVIRSIMYNAKEKYLSFLAGSGITFYSDAEKEYEECQMKAAAMKLALKS